MDLWGLVSRGPEVHGGSPQRVGATALSNNLLVGAIASNKCRRVPHTARERPPQPGGIPLARCLDAGSVRADDLASDLP